LHLGLSEDSLFACLSDSQVVGMGSSSGKLESKRSESKLSSSKDETELTKADLFYTNYRSLIDSYFVLKFDRFAKPLLKAAFQKSGLS
jgi:hypothetical protein